MNIRLLSKKESYISAKLTEELAEATVALCHRNTKLLISNKNCEKEIGKELADVQYWINQLLAENPNIKKHFVKKLQIRLQAKR